jgi:A/G-specific adenine glycosylase
MPVDSGSPIAATLLAWYDRHGRHLSWRARPGETADPYRVWLSEIMLQQTTVAMATPYFERFTREWPTVERLAAAEDGAVMAAWAGLGYYARARNLLACARAVAASGGRFPDTEEALRRLPGIGRYTAAAVAAIAFDRPAVVIDGNVERVVSRLFAIDLPLPGGRRVIEAQATAITPDTRPGDFAQAMMDLGATLCVPRRPACAICPLIHLCAGQKSGAPERFPVKPPRSAQPIRYGTLFWLEAEHHLLLERRPASGLLGGMMALPTGAWGPEPADMADAPVPAKWQQVTAGRHTFTHFTLEYNVVRAILTKRDKRCWWPIDRIADAGLPSLFADAVRRVQAVDGLVA